jgi:ribulose 1,5-bisphosphate synthetase/thiazole synthase
MSMNLYEQNPYWLMKDGIVASYASLDKDLDIDVAIMGAGISAALTAWYLRNSGLKIAVFDRRHVGMGSTAASTAFLQYEIDTPLTL